MKNLKSNKAYQKISKYAPEMPSNKMPDENPNSNNGIAALLLSLGFVLIGQLLILSKINTISSRINFNPIKAEDADAILKSEKEVPPPTEEKS